MQARVVTFVAPRRVELRPREVPEPGGGQLLVRTLFSGVSSGTELVAYRGDVDPEMALDDAIGALGGRFSYPFAYGYSCVGRVERSRTETVGEGDLVFAFHPHQDTFTVGAADVVPLGGCDPRVGTLFPLVETALQVSLDAGEVFEQPVAVVGLGVVGALTAALLVRAGARVLAAEPLGWRRDAAAALGLSAVHPDDLPAAVAEATGGAGLPLLVEASGNPAALAGALSLLAHEGTALVASWYGTRPVPLPLGGAFHRGRLTVRSSQVSTIPARLSPAWTRERRRAVALRLLGELPVGVLATHSYPFERAGEAYAALDRGEPGLLHAALAYEC